MALIVRVSHRAGPGELSNQFSLGAVPHYSPVTLIIRFYSKSSIYIYIYIYISVYMYIYPSWYDRRYIALSINKYVKKNKKYSAVH